MIKETYYGAEYDWAPTLFYQENCTVSYGDVQNWIYLTRVPIKEWNEGIELLGVQILYMKVKE